MSQTQPSSAAETYGQYFVPAMFVPWADALFRHASPRPGERVPDVAWGRDCGANGSTVGYLKRPCSRS